MTEWTILSTEHWFAVGRGASPRLAFENAEDEDHGDKFVAKEPDNKPAAEKKPEETDSDIIAAFTEVLDEVRPAKGKTPAPDKTPTKKTAAGAAKSAVKKTAKGFSEIEQGLAALFNPKRKLGSGLAFDEETYTRPSRTSRPPSSTSARLAPTS